MTSKPVNDTDTATPQGTGLSASYARLWRVALSGSDLAGLPSRSWYRHPRRKAQRSADQGRPPFPAGLHVCFEPRASSGRQPSVKPPCERQRRIDHLLVDGGLAIDETTVGATSASYE